MLPRPERLTRASLFSRAYTARKSVTTQLMTLYVLPKTNRPGQKPAVGSSAIPKENTRIGSEPQPAVKMRLGKMPLAGFVIAKKVCKSACQRNRVKRRVREAYRLIRREPDSALANSVLNLEQWYALVFVLNDKLLTVSWEEVRESVAECLRKADTKFGLGKRSSNKAETESKRT